MYNGLITAVPRRMIAELEEREMKKEVCLLLAKRSGSLSTISLTTILEIYDY